MAIINRSTDRVDLLYSDAVDMTGLEDPKAENGRGKNWLGLHRLESEKPLEDPKLKATNPKGIVGSDKLPLHLWPETATAMGCLGMLDGCLKYGRSNFRPAGVKASTYYDACRRHINKWFEGEEFDPDSGLPHLSHALACLAIIVDAQAAGVLNDDRQYPGGYAKLVDELTPHVKRLKEMHKDKHPKHWMINDDDGK